MSKQLSVYINKNESTKLSSQAELSAEKSQFYRGYYDLTSWKGSDGNTYDLTGSITASQDTILSAQWKPTEYSITYQLDGGTNGNNPTSYNIESETSALQDATKFQHALDKWTENGTQILSIEQGSHGDKTLSASYVKTKVTGTYNCNYEYPLLCFKSEEDGSTIALVKRGEPYDVTLVSSNNGTDWGSYTIGDTYTYPSVGSKFYLKKADSDTSDKFSKDEGWDCYQFSMSGKIAAYGNIQWLLDRNGWSLTCTDHCYSYLFNGCTSLTKAPELPATKAAAGCYFMMFTNCTSLTDISEIKLNITQQNYTSYPWACCSMFENCSSLSITTGQYKPKSKHVLHCAVGSGPKTPYVNMFNGTAGDFTGTPYYIEDYYCYGN